MLTQEKLKELVTYNPWTGEFYWLHRGSSVLDAKFAGKPAGGICAKWGYRIIRIDRFGYKAHRLAWLYMTGEMPPRFIDHIDGNRANNVWRNLRECSHAENMKNVGKHSDNTSGYKGVHLYKRTGRYTAIIGHNNKQIYLGTFATAEEAHRAYEEAANNLHQEFYRRA